MISVRYTADVAVSSYRFHVCLLVKTWRAGAAVAADAFAEHASLAALAPGSQLPSVQHICDTLLAVSHASLLEALRRMAYTWSLLSACPWVPVDLQVQLTQLPIACDSAVTVSFNVSMLSPKPHLSTTTTAVTLPTTVRSMLETDVFAFAEQVQRGCARQSTRYVDTSGAGWYNAQVNGQSVLELLLQTLVTAKSRWLTNESAPLQRKDRLAGTGR